MCRNSTLSHLSLRLGIYGKFYQLRDCKEKENAPAEQRSAADAFEVYLGALFQDAEARGEHHLVRDWLEKLWEQTIFPVFERDLGKAKLQSGLGKPKDKMQTVDMNPVEVEPKPSSAKDKPQEKALEAQSAKPKPKAVSSKASPALAAKATRKARTAAPKPTQVNIKVTVQQLAPRAKPMPVSKPKPAEVAIAEQLDSPGSEKKKNKRAKMNKQEAFAA